MTKQKNILKLELFNTIFILTTGVLFHFTYEWSHNNQLIGAFTAINESTWEHLKLLFFPMFLTTIIGYIYSKNIVSNYLCVKTKALFLSLSFVVVFFYTYTGIIGTNFGFINIGSFIVAILLEEFYTIKSVRNDTDCNNFFWISIWIILAILFIVFTFYPPHIGLFKDPITNSFGIFHKK